MAEGNGDRIEFAPALGNQRLGALRQFGAQPVELAEPLQERLVMLDPSESAMRAVPMLEE